MLIKSTLIAQASGSIAGATFSRNRGGAYVRSRVRGVNPNSPAQSRVRTTFSQWASAYAALTLSQKRTWEVYAENAVFLNALGDPIIPPAISIYVGANSLLEAVALPAVSVAPLTTTRPSLVVDEMSLLTWDVSDSEFTLTDVSAANATGGRLFVATSSAQTAGQRSFKVGYRRAVTQIDVSAIVNSFGAEPGAYEYVAGQNFRVRARVVRPDGAYSEPVFFNGTAVA